MSEVLKVDREQLERVETAVGYVLRDPVTRLVHEEHVTVRPEPIERFERNFYKTRGGDLYEENVHVLERPGEFGELPATEVPEDGFRMRRFGYRTEVVEERSIFLWPSDVIKGLPRQVDKIPDGARKLSDREIGRMVR